MVFPVVPRVQNVTVINKNIVYNDSILPIKDMGSNIKVTTISDMGEFSLEECLKTIFESNPNTTFNTIQYSPKEKKVYFYTDSEISLKAWNDKKTTQYKPINSSSEILEEIKKILISKKNTDSSCISIYDVAKLLKKKFDDSENHKDYWSNVIFNASKEIIFYLEDVYLHYSSWFPNQITIYFRTPSTLKSIIFSKENGDLYVKKSELSDDNTRKLLNTIGNIVLEMLDAFYKIDTKSSMYHEAQSLNANFYIKFNLSEVEIFNRVEIFNEKGDFKLEYNIYEDNYKYECNSYNILNIISGNEDELLKNIFVKIDDCPEWSRPFLYKIRQEQLNPKKSSVKKSSVFARIKDYITNSSNYIENNPKQK